MASNVKPSIAPEVGQRRYFLDTDDELENTLIFYEIKEIFKENTTQEEHIRIYMPHTGNEHWWPFGFYCNDLLAPRLASILYFK